MFFGKVILNIKSKTMKTSKKYFIYSFFLLFLMSNSCEKPEQEIPTGDHTFSCFIDGELFVPKGNTSISTTPTNDGLSLYKHENYFQASARDYKKFRVMFNIIDWNIGLHDLSESNGDYYNHSINHAMGRRDGVWYLSKEDSGSINFIEADIEGNTKGTFDFKLYNENDVNDVIHVTNGNFDD
jgi:hypothetical protein